MLVAVLFAPEEDEPTVAPRATPAAAACPSPAETLYFSRLARHMLDMAPSVESMGDLFTEVGNDPMLLISDAWRLELAGHMFQINVSAQDIIDLDAPASAVSVRDPTRARR